MQENHTSYSVFFLTESSHYLLPIDEFDSPNNRQTHLKQALSQYLSTILYEPKNAPRNRTVALHSESTSSDTITQPSEPSTTTDVFHTYLTQWKTCRNRHGQDKIAILLH